jgi:hypothetical protein
MHLSIPSERVARLTRPQATPEMVATAERNVQLARKWPQTIRASATDESFGTKLARAVQARRAIRSQSRKQADEAAEKERSRYKPLQRRKRTKGE